jgi:hypothetical protein
METKLKAMGRVRMKQDFVWRSIALLLLAVLALQPVVVRAQASDAIRFEDYVLETTDYLLPNGLRGGSFGPCGRGGHLVSRGRGQ